MNSINIIRNTLKISATIKATTVFFRKSIILLFLLGFNQVAIANLVDLTGPAPEERSITYSVNKPSNASKAWIRLDVHDADVSNEGELIINGNPAIPLFGSQGVSANNNKTAGIFLNTPASYWKNGNNTLRFKHTKTGGYIIENVFVYFTLASPTSEPVPEPTTTPVQSTSLPLDLSGSAPEEETVTVSVSKPSNASKATIRMQVYDADVSNEGELIINGNTAVKLFGSQGVSTNNNKTASIVLNTPASYWKNGNNTLRFKHTRTGGYIINSISVSFDGSSTSPPAPEPVPEPTPTPVPSTSLPLDLSGSAPEEETVTVSVSKPSNASKATIRMQVYDADVSNEGELIINGNPAIPLFGSQGVSTNNNKTTSVVLNTPASYWKNGNNTLRFKHTRTGGYIINSISVSFDGSSTSGSSSVKVNWVAPVARADETALSLSEISGYTIYYGTSAGNYTQSQSVNDGSATSAVVNNLTKDTYYMVITTHDTEGRESAYSSVVTKQAN